LSALTETQRLLDRVRAQSDAILVAYSDGKDSRVVLDLCSRTFARVEAFHLVLVPGLECTQVALAQARRRYGITIREYPHPILARLIRNGIYCDPSWRRDDVPDIGLGQIYALAMADAGIGWVATGNKRSDSAWRRNFMRLFNPDRVVHPIIGWHKYDVMAYLRQRGIGIPPSSGKESTGIDLSHDSLLWLSETFPEDFRRICEVFPYAEAVVWRKRFYADAA
jgi:3'-phosphoadenosine 5'-phosphosulfate sulfotransferase (PAPS reductase)/FAD synthetase